MDLSVVLLLLFRAWCNLQPCSAILPVKRKNASRNCPPTLLNCAFRKTVPLIMMFPSTRKLMPLSGSLFTATDLMLSSDKRYVGEYTKGLAYSSSSTPKSFHRLKNPANGFSIPAAMMKRITGPLCSWC